MIPGFFLLYCGDDKFGILNTAPCAGRKKINTSGQEFFSVQGNKSMGFQMFIRLDDQG